MIIQKSYKSKKPSFYVIPTPIGNLEDITIRSLNTLKELDVLYCEDTRVTKKLLNHFNISITLYTYNEYTNTKINEEILKKINEGLKVGIVSDAGMPLISDPGFKLIKYLKTNEINVIILPGACAFIEPMVYFCADDSPFVFKGFLPKQKTEYKNEIKKVCEEKFNTILYESPHRISRTLEYIKSIGLGNEILIAREISKIYETYIQGSVEEIMDHTKDNVLKGEIVLVVGTPCEEEKKDINYIKEIEDLIKSGYSLKDATKEIALKYNLSKNKLYNEYLTKKQKGE